MASEKRRVQRLLYQLQRTFGQNITYYSVSVGSFDPDTGDTATTVTEHFVRRAITLTHEVRNLLGGIIKNAGFGNLEVDDRMFLVSRKDISLSSVGDEDYIVFNGEKYNIVKRIGLDYDAGWLFHCRAVTATVPTPTEKVEDGYK